MDLHHDRLRINLAMYTSSTTKPTPPTPPKPTIGGPAPDEISEEAWARALERTRAREQKEAGQFGGLPPFPIPTKEEE